MSFKCDYCSEAQENNTKPNRIVVDTRSVTYNTNGQTTTGTEIVKEVDLCGKCEGDAKPSLEKLIDG